MIGSAKFWSVVAVHRLREVLADEVVRQVAVHALRDRVVTGLLPAVVLRLHDVAVRADLRIVREVRQRFRLVHGEAAETGEHPEQHGEDYERATRKRHGRGPSPREPGRESGVATKSSP
jgi:hypothetical protein